MQHPLDDVEELIRYLTHEKDRLKKETNKAARAWEFSEAKALAKSYHTVSNRLNNLKSLKDPDFDERARQYKNMVYFEALIKKYSAYPDLVNNVKEELKETNEILDKLENSTYELIENQHIDDALFQLVHGDIDSFKLHMNKHSNLIFDFRCTDQKLQITLSYNKGSLPSYIKKRLRGVGFGKEEGARKFVHALDVTNFRGALGIKQFLAGVLFDVFHRSWFDRPATLEINYPDSVSKDDVNQH